jgi:hypothetical protein
MLTLEPGASTFPGLGFCLTALPVFAVAPLSFLTLPILQSPAFSFFFEALSFLPVRLGTTQAVVLKLVALAATTSRRLWGARRVQRRGSGGLARVQRARLSRPY